MEKCQESQGFGAVYEYRDQNDFRRDLQDENLGDLYGNRKQVKKNWGEVDGQADCSQQGKHQKA